MVTNRCWKNVLNKLYNRINHCRVETELALRQEHQVLHTKLVPDQQMYLSEYRNWAVKPAFLDYQNLCKMPYSVPERHHTLKPCTTASFEKYVITVYVNMVYF